MNMPSLNDGDEGGAYPGEGGGIAGGENGPSPASCLVLDGDNGGEAGEIEEDEDKIGIGGLRRHVVSFHQLAHVGVLAVVIAEGVVVAKRLIIGMISGDRNTDSQEKHVGANLR